MMRTRWFGCGALLLTLGLVPSAPAAPAPAAQSPLAMVPADAPVVFQVRGIERTRDRLVAMIKNAAPDLAAQAQSKIEEAFDKGAENRLSKGLVKDGPHFFLILDLPDAHAPAKPKMAAVLHVTSYKEFQDGFLKEDERKELKTDEAGYNSATVNGHETFFVDRKEWVVVTDSKETATQFLHEAAGLNTKLSKADARRLLEPDVSFYVDMAAVNKQYGDQIKQFQQMMEVIVQQAAASGKADEHLMDMMKQMYAGMFQLVEDSRSLMFGFDFRPQGLAMHFEGRVGADSSSNKFLQDAKASNLAELDTLPGGEMIYTAMKVNPGLIKVFQPWMHGILTSLEGEDAKGLKEAFDQMADAGPESWAASVSIPPRGLQIWHFKDPVKATKAKVAFFEALKPGASLQTAMLKEKPEVKVDAETHRGFKLSLVTMVWDFEKMAEKLGPAGKNTTEGLKKLMGEGSKTWIGTDGKLFVQLTAASWEEAQRNLDEYLDGKNLVSKQAAFQEARKQLPAQSSMLALIDAPLYGKTIGGYMQAVLKGMIGKGPDLSSVKVEAGKSYVGMAVTLEPEHGSLDWWLPGSAVVEVRKMLDPATKNTPQD